MNYIFSYLTHNPYLEPKYNLPLVGHNTGNLLFWEALKKTTNGKHLHFNEFKQNKKNFTRDDVFITTDLIWITDFNQQELAKRIQSQLEAVYPNRLVPISIGIQSSESSSEFELIPELVRTLKALEKQSVLGLRGNYTQQILKKYGINHCKVIGCPSLFYPNDRNFQICSSVNNLKKGSSYSISRVAFNFRSFCGNPMSIQERRFLLYAADKGYPFVEQTGHNLTEGFVTDKPTYEYLSQWLNTSKAIFFEINHWLSFIKSVDFSVGQRFHGNVVAIWSGKPALFVPIDSRTRELIDFFNLPYISMNEFSRSMGIDYYYDLADYSLFNSTYAQRFDNYINFLKQNGIL